MVTAMLIVGRPLNGWMTWTPEPGILKLIVLGPVVLLDEVMAARKLPVPESAVHAAQGYADRSGREILHFNGHVGELTSVTVSSNGVILGGTSEGALKLWTRWSGQEAGAFPGHVRRVIRACFSRDGRTVASVGDDYFLRIWDLSSSAQRHAIKHEEPVDAVAFSPDGRLVASGGDDGALQIFDTATGSSRAAFAAGSASIAVINDLAFTPDGKTVVGATHLGLLKLWDIASGTVRVLGPVSGISRWQKSAIAASLGPSRSRQIASFPAAAVQPRCSPRETRFGTA